MKRLGSVIKAQQFDKRTMERIFATAKRMEELPPAKLLDGMIMATLFYEPSTRTRLSFESAMLRLGGRVINTENAKEFSSAAKGESLEDSIRVVSGYADIIVLRYPKEGGAARAAAFSNGVPIINAGDGAGQHPTQALLDLFTIKKRFGKIEGLEIAMVGDLLNGRTVRSLAYFLAKHYPKNTIYFVSPEVSRMKDDIKNYLDRYKVKWIEAEDLKLILPKLDVIYQTRVQKERFKNSDIYSLVCEQSDKLAISKRTLKAMKPEAIIMHPLPRICEISYAVDKDPRAYYFQQAQNGLYIRMALLKMMLDEY
jgi:aspartate carbamoyltransferase catalytic subunit